MIKLVWLVCFSIVFGAKSISGTGCGYSSCHPVKKEYVNVHIVAHTHDDVGWIKTVDEYYYNPREPYSGVKEILKSSYNSLLLNKDRRFMYVESAFLFKWWKEQNPVVKQLFKELINSGRLELVSGGWCMNDEATTHYHSIIDQFTLGLSKINDTFGACGRPKVGWQIDPFGHSSEMASIFAGLGFDGLFLGRIDFQDKAQRFKTKAAEMLWQGSRSQGKKSEIFTSVLYNVYWPPPGLCFDIFCGDRFKSAPHSKWNDLVKFMDNETNVYRTNNIMLTMGGDFHYMDAEAWFQNLDDLIEYGNSKQANGSKYNLIYSTPSCYLKAVNDEAAKAKITWKTKTDDFFPYAMENDAYWTGYFTSRPTLKRFERLGNDFLQVCKQLFVLGAFDNSYSKELDSLRTAMGILQHHDAISGTEHQHVADDYAKQLTKGFADCESITAETLNKLLPNKAMFDDFPHLPFTSCLLSNISQCEFSENSRSFIVTIYNPLSRPINHYVRIPVTDGRYDVKDSQGKVLLHQMVPIPEQVLHIPGRKSRATMDLVFHGVQVPPLGFKSFYVKKVKNTKSRFSPTHFNDKKVSIRLSKKSRFLAKVITNKKALPIEQQFLYYEGYNQYPRPSGAYIFNPWVEAKPVSDNASVTMYSGLLVTEIHQVFTDRISQVIRIYQEENFVEFQWLVSLYHQGRAEDCISRFTTSLKTNSTFYTDSNGREMVKRIRNFRPTWKLHSSQRISPNYYPVTTKILIRDPSKDVEVAVLTDRAQGGSSLKDGEIELMVHRRSEFDDRLGVSETLDEMAYGKPLVARGSHYLMVGPYINRSQETVAALEKDLAQRKLLEAWTFLSPTSSLPYSTYKQLYKMEYSALNYSLPKNVQILTLEPRAANGFLLRLEHVFEENEDSLLSKPATINLENLFAAFKIRDLRETTLGGNQWLDENNPMKFGSYEATRKAVRRKRLKIKTSRKISLLLSSSLKSKGRRTGDKFKITLNPMQIRTFVVWIENGF